MGCVDQVDVARKRRKDFEVKRSKVKVVAEREMWPRRRRIGPLRLNTIFFSFSVMKN